MMKKNHVFYFLFAAMLMSFTACSPSLTPFTQQMYEQNNWSVDELRQIQFYLSRDLTLRRVVSNAESDITEGKIRMRQGRKIEEIRIPSGTPGVLQYLPKENRFAINFDERDKNRTLIFGPDSRRGDRYIIKVAKWDNEKGILRYDDRNYFIYQDEGLTTLLVDLKRFRRTTVNSDVARGNRL